MLTPSDKTDPPAPSESWYREQEPAGGAGAGAWMGMGMGMGSAVVYGSVQQPPRASYAAPQDHVPVGSGTATVAYPSAASPLDDGT